MIIEKQQTFKNSEIPTATAVLLEDSAIASSKPEVINPGDKASATGRNLLTRVQWRASPSWRSMFF